MGWLGWPLLLVQLGVWWRVVRTWGGLRDPLLLVSTAAGLGFVHLLLSAAFLWGRLGWWPWLALHGLSLFALSRVPPSEQLESSLPIDKGFLLGALGGAVAVAAYALFQMAVSQVVEDGFFVHSANMGLIQRGHIPPVNFLGEPLQGHYGKDLLTALLAALSGCSFLDVEWVSTVVFQVLHFWLLCSWFRQESGSSVAGLLAAGLAFFGANFGSRAGMMDTITNNNALAFYLLAQTLYWGRRACSSEQPYWAPAGVLLGALALVYETHFGLVVLCGLSTLLVLCPPRSTTLGAWKRLGAILMLAGILAATEGGVVTALASRLWARDIQHQRGNVTEMQSQRLQISFPKADFFRLRLDNLRPSRSFEGKLRPWQAEFAASSASVYPWERPIVSCFWYPAWCAPFLCLLVMARKRWRESEAGRSAILFGFLGFYSGLVPACVGFGYFDSETGRWLFVTAYAWAIVYGLVLGQWWAQVPRRSLQGAICLLILAWSLWFDSEAARMKFGEMRRALASPGVSLFDGSPGIVPGAGLRPEPWRSLRHHYQFDAGDVAAAKALGRLAAPEDRFLANYRDDPPPPGAGWTELLSGGLLNTRGLQVGLAGILPAGLTGAPENRLGAPMFSQSLAARAFWADGQTLRLGPLGVQWLLIRDADLAPSILTGLENEPQLKQVYSAQGSRIFQVALKLPQDAPLRDFTIVPEEIEVFPCKARQAYLLPVEVRGEGDSPSLNWITLRYVAIQSGEVANASDLLVEPVRLLEGARKYLLRGVAPHVPGLYRLEWKPLGLDSGGAPAWSKVVVVEVGP